MYIFNLIIEYIFLKLFVKEKLYFFKMEGDDDIQMGSEEKILLDTKTNEEVQLKRVVKLTAIVTKTMWNRRVNQRK